MTDEQHAYRAQTCRHRVTTRVSGTRDLWRCSWCNTLLQDNVTVIDPDAGEALIEQVAEDGTTRTITLEIEEAPGDPVELLVAAIEGLTPEQALGAMVKALAQKWSMP